MRRLFFLIVIVVMALAFSSQSIAIQYTILKPENGTPTRTFCISISELGAYDIVETGFGPESIVGECVWIAPIKNLLSKALYQYYYDVGEGMVKIEFVNYIKEDDQLSCSEITYAKIGDTFTGVSGTTYVLQEQNVLSQEQIQYLADKSIVVVGEWVAESNVTLLRFNFSGLEVYYDLYINGKQLCETFIPETEGGGPGGCVSISEVSCVSPPPP